MISIKMTDQEAHAVLRAIASSNADEDTEDHDRAQTTWVASRILNALVTKPRIVIQA